MTFIDFSSVYATLVSYGYPGIFLASFLGSATVIFPVPAFALTFALGGVLNPFLVALFSATGSALGELTGYAIGKGGKKIAGEKNVKWLRWGEKWFEKRKEIFPIIVLFAATPLPDDVVGILAGLFEYPWKKFLLASFIGKLLMNMAIAYAGFLGLSEIFRIIGGL